MLASLQKIPAGGTFLHSCEFVCAVATKSCRIWWYNRRWVSEVRTGPNHKLRSTTLKVNSVLQGTDFNVVRELPVFLKQLKGIGASNREDGLREKRNEPSRAVQMFKWAVRRITGSERKRSLRGAPPLPPSPPPRRDIGGLALSRVTTCKHPGALGLQLGRRNRWSTCIPPCVPAATGFERNESGQRVPYT